VTSITDPEISTFLAAGTRTGKLAYVGMDGRPLVTPVWFIVEHGCIVADACAGAEVDLGEYTATWLAEQALASPQAGTAFPRDELT
jgi:hypothetical protein